MLGMEVFLRLTNEKLTELARIAKGFGFGSVQTCAHLIAVLSKAKISNEELLEWVRREVLGIKLEIVEAKKDMADFDSKKKYHSRRCPDCGSHLNIVSVN